MHWKTFLALAALLVTAVAGAAPQTAFKEVPHTHWAYAALQRIERAGVTTGYPEQTFAGKRLLTRYEFAVALQQVAQTAIRTRRSSDPLRAAVLGNLGLAGAPAPQELLRLLTEFDPELRLLGADVEQFARALKSADPANDPPRSQAYEEGVQDAEAEWKKQEVTLHTAGGPLGPRPAPVSGMVSIPFLDQELGLPYHMAAGCIVSPEIMERLRGHNDQVYRLILQHGLPGNAKRQWLPQILEPAKYWSFVERAPQVLRCDGKELTSPDGSLHLRLQPAPEGEKPLLLSARNGAPFEVLLYFLDRRDPQVEVLWGPPKSDLLFVRYEDTGRLSGENYVALDTRTGRRLSLAYAP